MKLKRISPSDLTPKQKEAYHFQKVSAILADYGYQTIKLSDDWCGADFIAQHLDGSVYKVQLKGRLTVDQKYENKDLLICFPYKEVWYIYPHDIILSALINNSLNSFRTTYEKLGEYHFPTLSTKLIRLLAEYRII